MAKALNGETSSQEKDELLILLRENPAFQQQYELITRIWSEREHENKDEEDAKRHILKIINRAETESIDEEMMTRMRQAIESLPPRCKIIFKLIREDGLKYKEVAEILNISVNTIDVQMAIAVKKICMALHIEKPGKTIFNPVLPEKKKL